MAIDDEEKRRSTVAISLYAMAPSVTPNASKDLEWRQQVGYGYSGIASGAPATSKSFALSLTGLG